MGKYLYSLSLIALVGITGCSKPANTAEGDASAPPQPTTPASPVAQPAKGTNLLLTATPGTAGCDVGTVAKFNWDLSSNPAISEVELLVGDGPEAKLFAAGGRTGEAETGPWVYSGTTFVLRNKADQAELDRVVISGPTCPPPVASAAK
ncbi:hypothetical protein GCM10027431_01190 [Lysobacter rhizosphaerae]